MQNKKETKPPCRHIMFKLQKIKEKERTEMEKNIYRGTKIRITWSFSSEIMQVRREWTEIFKVLTGKKNHQPRILYSVKLIFQK